MNNTFNDLSIIISATKDCYDISSKLGALEQQSQACYSCGNIALYLFARGRIEYWREVREDRYPFGAIQLLKSAVEVSDDRLTTAAIMDGHQCAIPVPTQSFGGLTPDQILHILHQNGVIKNPTLDGVREAKRSAFASAFWTAIGDTDSGFEAAVLASLKAEPTTIPEILAYIVSAIANELAAMQRWDEALKLHRRVCSAIDSSWIRGQLFFGETLLRAYQSQTDSLLLDEANSIYSSILVALRIENVLDKPSANKIHLIARQQLTRIDLVRESHLPLKQLIMTHPITGEYL